MGNFRNFFIWPELLDSFLRLAARMPPIVFVGFRFNLKRRELYRCMDAPRKIDVRGREAEILENPDDMTNFVSRASKFAQPRPLQNVTSWKSSWIPRLFLRGLRVLFVDFLLALSDNRKIRARQWDEIATIVARSAHGTTHERCKRNPGERSARTAKEKSLAHCRARYST